MKQDKAIKLAEALESGEYTQGRNALTQRTKDGDLDCCLGVACKLVIADGVDVRVTRGDSEDGNVMYDFEGGVLPPAVMHHFGFKHAQGSVEGDTPLFVDQNGNRFHSLASMNDGGVDFPTIARVIRENWERL